MRLLNLYSYEFEEFYDDGTPPYAILSHRWSKREISHHDLVNGRHQDSDAYDKIVGFCEFARERPVRIRDDEKLLFHSIDVQWGWVDTCCIDKTSSAELSEAINSMFTWYHNAAVCYVFLVTVPALEAGDAAVTKAFEDSDWFDRGWTLQELLAPWEVIFCNREWEVIGHKCTHGEGGRPLRCSSNEHRDFYGPSLTLSIARLTLIKERYLTGPLYMFDASIACRMSWAARRKTTRIEDAAYCLLGLFEVHMPLLYGERARAFVRLQEELVKRTNDQSIFCWLRDFKSNPNHGVFAYGPSDFRWASNIVSTGQAPDAPYTITNNGLEIRAPSTKLWSQSLEMEVFLIKLNCGFHKERLEEEADDGRLSGALVQTKMAIANVDDSTPNIYDRVYWDPWSALDTDGEEMDERVFYVRAWAWKDPAERKYAQRISAYRSTLRAGG